ncbi:MAG: hypothetical protein IT428_32560 [Planctomycetaceae bacterium]|nr:hypothetical protein [Planctomycetaceae bacterium]
MTPSRFYRIDLIPSEACSGLSDRDIALLYMGMTRLCVTQQDADVAAAFLNEENPAHRFQVLEIDGDVVVRAFVRWCEKGQRYDANAWAFHGIMDMVRESPEIAWPLVRAAILSSPSPEASAIIAAGPLENLLCFHGPGFVDRVVRESSRDPQFRDCLRLVWGHSRMDPDVYAKIREQTG